MGESNRKRRIKREFLARNPYCCFCGGKTPATTEDHVPSRQMFDGRQRPKGLEVPACERCNQATKQDEQVAAMLGRVFPDPEEGEIRRIMQAVKNNNPGLLEEMLPAEEHYVRLSQAGIADASVGGPLNCSGPLLNKSIGRFGAKLGLSLYYSVVGQSVPSEGGVAVRRFTNFDAVTGEIPSDLTQILGPPETLRQGRKHVAGQFAYAFAVADEVKMAAFYSTFRQSFAVLSWVAVDVANFGVVDDGQIYRPGEF